MPASSNTPSPDDPRQRARDVGVPALTDGELVALVLGTGTPATSAHLLALAWLERAGGLAGVARGVGPPRGVGSDKALRVRASIELGRRVASISTTQTSVLEDAAAVATWATPRLAHLDQEELWLLSLDRRCHLRSARRVAMGSLRGLAVETADVFRIALSEGARAFVLVHNHPSGDPTPSVEDISFTKVVAKGAAILGVPLADHVVVAREGFAQVPFG